MRQGCAYRKPKPERSGDEVRQGSDLKRGLLLGHSELYVIDKI
jgi:hypothetical protein